MVRCELTREGEFSLWTLVLQGSQRHGRSHVGIASARDQGSQHTPAGAPKEIGDHAAECEVGILEELVHPVRAPSAVPSQAGCKALSRELKSG